MPCVLDVSQVKHANTLSASLLNKNSFLLNEMLRGNILGQISRISVHPTYSNPFYLHWYFGVALNRIGVLSDAVPKSHTFAF
jgi:hypothetical protein